MSRVLAVIPARGGSKGLPGKNVRPFAGLPLIAHSIRCAKAAPAITRTIVSTDSPKIAAAARRAGGEAPFFRPKALSRDKTPLWPVLQHALAFAEKEEGRRYDFLVLLDPTSPTRTPADIKSALAALKRSPRADGIVSVSEPDFSPIWHSVTLDGGWMKDLSVAGAKMNRRQDAPRVLRINGLLYIWRTSFLRKAASWRPGGRHLGYEVPDLRACSIDTREQFDKVQALVRAGLIKLPWLRI